MSAVQAPIVVMPSLKESVSRSLTILVSGGISTPGADTRPPTLGERAADRETKPEDGAEVDGELGQGQFTFLSGEIWNAYP